MRVLTEPLDFTCEKKFIIICCLISFVRAIDWKEEEERIANDYKGRGELLWKWEIDSFCQSTITNKEFPGSLWGVFTDQTGVLLPLAHCNVVNIMILTCIHRFKNEQGILRWNARSYLYSWTDQKVYTFDLKRNKEHCNGAPVDIIDNKEEISWEYKLRPGTPYSRQNSQMKTVRNWREAEEKIADDYKGHGKVPWKTEIKSFCESTIVNNKFPGSLWSAYIADMKVVLPSADCKVVQMETLTCVHRYTNEEGILVWNEESYVAGLTDDKIYAFDLKRNKDECNGIPLSLIDYKEEIGSANGLEPIKIHTDYGQPPLIDPRRFRFDPDYQTRIADFYKGNNTSIEWKWEVEPFCKSQSQEGVTFSGANIKKREIILEWIDCTRVELEILTCKYEKMTQEIREFFANGLNHDLFKMEVMPKSSRCAERYPNSSLNNYWVIKMKIYLGERKPITTKFSERSQSLLKTIGNLLGRPSKGKQP